MKNVFVAVGALASVVVLSGNAWAECCYKGGMSYPGASSSSSMYQRQPAYHNRGGGGIGGGFVGGMIGGMIGAYRRRYRCVR